MDNTENIKNTNTKEPHRLNKRVTDLIYIALFTAIIAVCSQISIPTAIPFTLQTLGVFLAGGLLGWKRGTASVLVYLLLGLAGIPVFSNFKSGLGALLGVTGGYIIGFIFTAFIVGLMCDKLGRKLWVIIVSSVLGLAVCYLFGTVWFVIVWNGNAELVSSKGSMSFLAAVGTCMVPYLPFDAAKIAVAAIIINRLDKTKIMR